MKSAARVDFGSLKILVWMLTLAVTDIHVLAEYPSSRPGGLESEVPGTLPVLHVRSPGDLKETAQDPAIIDREATRGESEIPIDAAPIEPVENSLSMRFVPVGEIMFSIWCTRVKDYEEFARDTHLKSSAWRTPGFQQGPDHPVVNVTWNDAVAFCQWLTARERTKGLIKADEAYRLPTDSEWSSAVGLPREDGKTPESRDMATINVFPWGTQWPPPPGSGNYTGEETGADVYIVGYDDQYSWTSPVGSFPANRAGLYDMGGNVWQWCLDSWNNRSEAKVLRGASWHKAALKLGLLSSCRMHARPDSSTEYYGFRVVRAADRARLPKKRSGETRRAR